MDERDGGGRGAKEGPMMENYTKTTTLGWGAHRVIINIVRRRLVILVRSMPTSLLIERYAVSFRSLKNYAAISNALTSLMTKKQIHD